MDDSIHLMLQCEDRPRLTYDHISRKILYGRISLKEDEMTEQRKNLDVPLQVLQLL